MNLTGVHAGTESFDAFARRTIGEWRALAAYICRRVAPSAIGHLDDVVQELLVECWLRIPSWDPARGAELDRYCIFGAVCKVSRRLKGKRSDPLALRHWAAWRPAGTSIEGVTPSAEREVELRLIAEEALARCFAKLRCHAMLAVLEEEGDMFAVVRRLRARGVGRNKARAAFHDARRRLKEAYAA